MNENSVAKLRRISANLGKFCCICARWADRICYKDPFDHVSTLETKGGFETFAGT